jgi:UDPglucose 6-dehydrogenase
MNTTHNAPLIGFIGQGFVGKNYANDFENRGFTTVRYSLEPEYAGNKDKIHECEIVFIAVPTPTTPSGFDASIVKSALALVGSGKTAVIKSTVLPGHTAAFQKDFPDKIVIFSPEFLREATAAEDAAHPYSNIIGTASDSPEHKAAAELLLSVLPKAPAEIICSSTEAELIKYAQNVSGYIDIMTFNVFYDLAQKTGANWEPILAAMRADPNIPSRFANPVHKNGRGAGGHCLIKDFAALRKFFAEHVSDPEGLAFLNAAEMKNRQLLRDSGKDKELLEGVYGKE